MDLLHCARQQMKHVISARGIGEYLRAVVRKRMAEMKAAREAKK